MGYRVVDSKDQAGFTYRFDVQRFSDEYDPSIRFIVLITLFYNQTNMEMVSFGHPFADIDDMYAHTQFLFYRAAVLIPSISDATVAELTTRAVQAEEAVQVAQVQVQEAQVQVQEAQVKVQEAKAEAAQATHEAQVAQAALAEHSGTTTPRQQRAAADLDNSWQNKLIYIRASFDYPISYLELKNVKVAYNGDPLPPQTVIPLDHKIMPQMGATAGIEIQPLGFLSLEVNFQVTKINPMQDLLLLNMSAGAELKFNLKTQYMMIQPYGTFIYHLVTDENFAVFPQFTFGGGLQVGTRAGPGMFFINISYLMSLDDPELKNPYSTLAPDPKTIPYKRFVIGLGIGYKFGLF